MSSKFLEETNKEFKDFSESDPVSPPKQVTDQILSMVHRDLNPNAWLIFAKLSLIHFGAGIITLSLCPQFGVRLFGEGPGLMKFFLNFGTYGCIALCGAFFVGVSLFISGLVLGREELRVLRRHKVLQISALTLLSMGAFIMADAEILFAFAAAWVLGSMIGGMAMLELGWLLRKPHSVVGIKQ